MLYRFARRFCRGIFALFLNWKVIGSENVPAEGPVLLCSNHISLLDPPLVGSGLLHRKVYFMAKAELFDVPVLGALIRDLGAFPVKRGAADRNMLRFVYKLLEDGHVLGVFPEGTRSKTGELEQGHSGAAVFALRSQATVIPVAVIGPLKWFGRPRIIYGKPLDLSEHRAQKATKETISTVTGEIMEAIEHLIRDHSRME